MSGNLVNIKTHTESNLFLPEVLNKFIVHYERGNLVANKFHFESEKEHQEIVEKMKNFFYKKKKYIVDDFGSGLHVETIKQASIIYSGKSDRLDLVKILIKNNFYYFNIDDVLFIK